MESYLQMLPRDLDSIISKLINKDTLFWKIRLTEYIFELHLCNVSKSISLDVYFDGSFLTDAGRYHAHDKEGDSSIWIRPDELHFEFSLPHNSECSTHSAGGDGTIVLKAKDFTNYTDFYQEICNSYAKRNH